MPTDRNRPRFITLTTLSGRQISLNISQIRAIDWRETHAHIHLIGRPTISVGTAHFDLLRRIVNTPAPNVTP